ncbi:hypothetical protein C8Q77DRAFT_152307 [Trametes polyzona]|nr:hypothetical protein C8Q77DRAFT_152307 [Trametes polyzona]
MTLPWDMMQNSTIRAAIRDWGFEPYVGRARRERLVQILKDAEAEGPEAVLARLQERARRYGGRDDSPEFEYLGPVLDGDSEVGASASADGPGAAPSRRRLVPVVEIPSRARARSHRDRAVSGSPSSASSGTSPSRTAGSRASSSSGKQRDQGTPPAETARVRPPSYAIMYQLEEEVREPSNEPIPLECPDMVFDGVVLALRRRPGGEGSVSTPPMRLEAVELRGRSVDGVKQRQKHAHASSASERTSISLDR